MSKKENLDWKELQIILMSDKNKKNLLDIYVCNLPSFIKNRKIDYYDNFDFCANLSYKLHKKLNDISKEYLEYNRKLPSISLHFIKNGVNVHNFIESKLSLFEWLLPEERLDVVSYISCSEPHININILLDTIIELIHTYFYNYFGRKRIKYPHLQIINMHKLVLNNDYSIGTVGCFGKNIHLLKDIEPICNLKNDVYHSMNKMFDLITCKKCLKEARMLGLIKIYNPRFIIQPLEIY